MMPADLSCQKSDQVICTEVDKCLPQDGQDSFVPDNIFLLFPDVTG